MPTLLDTLAISNAANQDNPVINMGKYPTPRGNCAGAVLTDSDGNELGTTGNPVKTTISGVATEATLNSIKTKVEATGSTAQNIQGSQANGAAFDKPITIAGRDWITGVNRVPSVVNFGGQDYWLTLIPDLNLRFLSYSALGEMHTLAASTDGAQSGAKFMACDASRNVLTKRPATTTATLSNVSASVASVTVLAANSSRYGATVVNDASDELYLKCGSSASSTSFTVKLQKNDYYEVPFDYTGILTGSWAGATGSARVTEFTA